MLGLTPGSIRVSHLPCEVGQKPGLQSGGANFVDHQGDHERA